MMLQSTQCGFYRAPDPAIFHKHGQPLSVVALSGQCPQHRVQLNCPLIWAILKLRGAVAMVRCVFPQRTIAIHSGDMLVVLVW